MAVAEEARLGSPASITTGLGQTPASSPAGVLHDSAEAAGASDGLAASRLGAGPTAEDILREAIRFPVAPAAA
jgi:hypothetical protein